MKNPIPMIASIHQLIKVEIIKYLLSEPYAAAPTIATALERPLCRVREVLRSAEFLQDSEGNYALLSSSPENTAA